MKIGESDKLCFVNYLVGGFVALMSIIGFLVILFFKDLFPLTFKYGHSGLGVIQGICLCILTLIFFGALKFISFSWEYQQAHGL